MSYYLLFFAFLSSLLFFYLMLGFFLVAPLFVLVTFVIIFYFLYYYCYLYFIFSHLNGCKQFVVYQCKLSGYFLIRDIKKVQRR